MIDLRKILKTFSLFACILLVISFIVYSEEIKDSLINALMICGKSIIPGLFPILCIVLIIVNLGYVSYLPEKAYVYFLFVLAMISGYPVGSKLLSTAVKSKQLTEYDAKKILPTMVCAGPAFIINLVGSNIFGSSIIGLRIYLSIVFSNFTLFLILGGYKIKLYKNRSNTNFINTISNSIKQSADSIMNICGYFLLLSAIASIAKDLFNKKTANCILYVLEVTNGVFQSRNIYLTCAILSFGGLCVIMQIISSVENLKINVAKLLIIRFISAAVSNIYLKIGFIIFPSEINIISTTHNASTPAVTYNLPFAIFFLFSVFVLLLSIKRAPTGNFYNDVAV